MEAPCVLDIQDNKDLTQVRFQGRDTAFVFEFGIALTLMHLHEETKKKFVADHVAFTHRPDDISEMEHVLHCPVRSQAA